MMKHVILSILIISCATSCSKSCSDEAVENLELWQAEKPSDYAYTIQRSAFSSPEYLGPYRIEIINNAIDTAYFDIEKYNDDVEYLFEGWDDYETISEFIVNSRIEDVFDRIINYDGDCTVVFDPVHYFPSEYRVLPEADIADSGVTIRILDFEILQ